MSPPDKGSSLLKPAGEAIRVSPKMSLSRYPGDIPKCVYSDLNHVVLGCLLERAGGDTLDKLARTFIFEPLELKCTMFNPTENHKTRMPTTGRGRGINLKSIRQRFHQLAIQILDRL